MNRNSPLIDFVIAMVIGAAFSLWMSDSHADTLQFTKDKQDHLAVSAVIGAASRLVIDDPYVAFGVAMVPGVAKEIYDMHHKDHHTASWQDLAFDAIGAAIGVTGTHLVIRHNFIGYTTRF